MATNSPVLFKFGTRAEYNALAKKADNALYFLTDTGELLRGEKNLAQANFYEGTRLQENGEFTESKEEAIARVTTGATLIKNDVCVIKELLFGDSYSHTAYVYDGTNWKAMDGNYNAENVYFDQDLTFTTNVGYIEIGSSGSEKVQTQGKNVKEVFEMLFSQPENPDVTQPSLSIAASQNKAYEVGSVVTPSYTLTFKPGTYEYGPATGITATYSVTDTTGNTAQTATSGTFPELTVTDDTAYYINATATYTQGSIPVNNLGNNVEFLRISEGTATAKSNKLYGYRQFFYGAMTAGTALTSANIRKLTNSNAAVSAKTLPQYEASSVANAAKVVIAIPATSSIGVKKVTMPVSQNADITSEFKLQENYVQVEGKSGYQAVDYKVWVYEPAALDPTENYVITLG